MATTEIGQRIKDLREANGLTQNELASRVGVSRETVNQWENGTRDIKTAKTAALADVFSTTCDYIIRGVQSEVMDIYRETGLDHTSVDVLREMIELYNEERWFGNPVKSMNKALSCKPLVHSIAQFLSIDKNMRFPYTVKISDEETCVVTVNSDILASELLKLIPNILTKLSQGEDVENDKTLTDHYIVQNRIKELFSVEILKTGYPSPSSNVGDYVGADAEQ